MKRQLTQADRDLLEAIVDRADLRAVIDGLCGICVAKVQHIETNWQDNELAKRWARDASKLAKFHGTLEVMP